MDQAHIEANRAKLTQHVDAEYTRSLIEEVFEILNQVYFRPVFIGFDELEERNHPDAPLIYIGNHSGMAFPWDAMMFGAGIFQRNGWQFEGNCVRPLVAPMLTASPLMNPFMIEDLWKRVGGLEATFLNFETMMQHSDSHVLIYPEGLDGIGKGFDKRYQLQRFATSFVRMAIKYKADVLPVMCVNGEWVNPYMYKVPAMNRVSRIFGIPYLPLGIILPLLLFLPWMLYYSMPAKLTYVKGRRIRWQDLTDKAYEDLTNEDVEEIAARVRDMAQQDLDAGVKAYGHQPYRWGEMLRKAFRYAKYFPFYLPFGWVLIFNEFDRKWRIRKPGERVRVYTGPGATLLMCLRNPMAFFFLIPLIGWIPILMKGLKKYNGKR